jgi:hypothetical protein
MTSTNVLPILKSDTKGRVRTPAADRDAILDLFEQGGMSGAAFARLHGIRYSTFAHWRHLRRRRLPKPDTPSTLFQEVVIQPTKDRQIDGLALELPLGIRVRLERADQIPFVAALCRHLQGNAPC